jgi:membrane associated rhomboid family serine protease
MFLPLHDSVPLRYLKAPTATYALMAAAVLVYGAVSLDILPIASDMVFAGLGLVPAQLFGEQVLPDGLPLVPSALTLVTSILIHASFLHLAGNMLFLWVFGDNVEDAMGHIKFLIFYLACGVIAGLVHAWVVPTSDAPLIGASGAVAGVIAAYLMLHPRVRVWVLALKAIPLRISAAVALGIWIVIQIVMVMLPQVGPVAWWAHIGGLIAGAVLVIFMRRPGVALFDRRLTTA